MLDRFLHQFNRLGLQVPNWMQRRLHGVAGAESMALRPPESMAMRPPESSMPSRPPESRAMAWWVSIAVGAAANTGGAAATRANRAEQYGRGGGDETRLRRVGFQAGGCLEKIPIIMG